MDVLTSYLKNTYLLNMHDYNSHKIVRMDITCIGAYTRTGINQLHLKNATGIYLQCYNCDYIQLKIFQK